MPSQTAEHNPVSEQIPVAPSIIPTLQREEMPAKVALIDRNTVFMCVASTFVGIIAGFAGRLLIILIALITNLSFYGRLSLQAADARANHLGAWVILIPAAGAFVIGLMARFGSRDVAGHGIPETMERILSHESRIPARMTFLKPLSAAVSIGTGGPFGPEGPIIATGGALGSLIGQLLPLGASQRKVLLAAGAAAGISAAFNCPIAAVLLAVELLLFEFRPRSIIPVVFASAAAAMVRLHFDGSGPAFPFSGPAPHAPGFPGLFIYTVFGVIIGMGAVVLTRSVFAIESMVARLPVHWFFPLIGGALIVGIVGYFDASIFGAGYFNIDWLLSGKAALMAAAVLCILKFVAWTISLGSGTSGGTLAPVFTIGGSLAMVLAVAGNHWMPPGIIDLRVAALVGMVAIFAGASRALLTSIIFAFEVTREPAAVLPVLCGCSTAYVVCALLMRESIMTEKIARRGVGVPAEYFSDLLAGLKVLAAASTRLTLVRGDETLSAVRERLAARKTGWTHQGYPVVDNAGHLMGVLTLRDFHNPERSGREPVGDLIGRPAITIPSNASLREVVNKMIRHDVGRVVVVDPADRRKPIGMVTRGDVLRAQRGTASEFPAE